MFLSDSNVNNQTWNLATTCTHSCLPHNNQCVLFVSRVSTWRSWKTVETESVHYENKTKSTTQASHSGKRSRRLKNHVSTRDKHGNSFFEINIIWTVLTSGARVFDHRHQNKQDRKIISHPIHHVFPFSASWALESALCLRRTEQRLHTLRAPLGDFSPVLLSERTHWSRRRAVIFVPPTRLQTTDCTLCDDWRL